MATTTAGTVCVKASKRPRAHQGVDLLKARQFQYYDEGVRTKEEKQLFLAQLTKKLNARYENETGAWDELRAGTQVRNLKKERLLNATPSAAAASAAAAAAPAAPGLRPIEQLLLDWQTTLVTASRLNGNTLARHSSNRGACNEDLLRGFLASMLSSRYIGIGCGEVLAGGGAPPRQVDVVLYNTEFPCLQPARFGTAAAANNNCACFYRESIMAVIEVKTTLTNQDLRDVATAAPLLSPLPFLVFAFDSQTSLKAIDLSVLPENVAGVYTLSHGSVVACRGDNNSCTWHAIHPSKRAPLTTFYGSLLGVLASYGLPPLQRVVEAMQRQLSQPVEEEKGDAASATPFVENVLCAIDFNRLSIQEENLTPEGSKSGPRA